MIVHFVRRRELQSGCEQVTECSRCRSATGMRIQKGLPDADRSAGCNLQNAVALVAPCNNPHTCCQLHALLTHWTIQPEHCIVTLQVFCTPSEATFACLHLWYIVSSRHACHFAATRRGCAATHDYQHICIPHWHVLQAATCVSLLQARTTEDSSVLPSAAHRALLVKVGAVQQQLTDISAEVGTA